MNAEATAAVLREIANGRTELVLDLLAQNYPVDARDHEGVSLVARCAYYGDVSAIKYLLAHGESLDSLGKDSLCEASFHGHWRLCKFLLERGANVNAPLPDTGETPLHAALSKADRIVYDRVLHVLLAHNADPNCVTKDGVESGSFMRDARTRGETPLHRAAAFGGNEAISLLLDAGAVIDAKDMNNDTPLAWASWYLRPPSILRQLCFGDFKLHPQYQEMRSNLLGYPQPIVST